MAASGIGVDTNTMMRREFGRLKRRGTPPLGVLVLSALTLASCSLFGGHKDRVEVGSQVAHKPAEARPSVSDHKSALRDLVSIRIKDVTKNAVEQRAVLVKRKPYFYREYEVYPDGPDRFDVTTQERESRTTPLIADVVLAKQRFVTRLHRNRKKAQSDTNFLRDTGTETITYELRNGGWVRVGSLFVASESEENVNGEWVPLEETAKRTVAAEEEKSKGWFGRTWSKIVGR